MGCPASRPKSLDQWSGSSSSCRAKLVWLLLCGKQTAKSGRAFASKFSHNTACIAKKERPITLILKNSHYTYLAPPAQIGTPHTWMTDSTNKLTIDLTGNGRHTPASSSRTPSVRTYQGHKSSLVGVQLASSPRCACWLPLQPSRPTSPDEQQHTAALTFQHAQMQHWITS